MLLSTMYRTALLVLLIGLKKNRNIKTGLLKLLSLISIQIFKEFNLQEFLAHQ